MEYVSLIILNNNNNDDISKRRIVQRPQIGATGALSKQNAVLMVKFTESIKYQTRFSC